MRRGEEDAQVGGAQGCAGVTRVVASRAPAQARRRELPLRRGSLSFRSTKRNVMRRGEAEDVQVGDAVA